ncbi:MAG TPA: PHP-associated domain-containing protein [Candidatus Binatia bacterium]|nr:PHP-associated domain-containing protein [Candidatus Binatia bacterium]
MTERLGRADLHIHTLASDGTAGVVEILDHVERNTDLDVIAITDHERIDAALVGRQIARDRGLSFEVVVGEEVTTLGGHLLALWIEEPVKPFRSLRSTIAAIHDQGGIAIPAHPLVPYPLCAQGFVLRRLLDDEDRYRPDAIEAFNPTTLGRPWHSRVVRFAQEHGLARVGNSDAHDLDSIGIGHTTFPGRDGSALRAAIEARTTHHHGSFHPPGQQIGTFGKQLRKYGRDARASIGGRLLRNGRRRDLGYPRDDAPDALDRAGLLTARRGAGASGDARANGASRADRP